MKVLQTSTFKKHIKKLKKNQKIAIDQVIHAIMNDPTVGEMKKGDLTGIQVYKFRMVNQLTLLAYEVIEDQLTLVSLSFGSHENFYRDIK